MTLKFLILGTTLIATSTPAFAERTETQQALLETGTFTSLTLVGAAVGGPVGMIAGALGGVFLAEETRSANQNELALAQQTKMNQQLEADRVNNEQKLTQMQKALVDKLTFQVLFASGEDTLNELDHQRVLKLADYLKEHPNLMVHLDGHTDIRGSDEYNNVLSLERAKSIKTALINEGIEAHRITLEGHGAHYAKADQTRAKDNPAEYAQDRKVVIELAPEGHNNEIVQF